MNVFRTLAPTFAALAIVVLTVSLGNWQSRRAAEKLALHEQHERMDREAPRRLGPERLDENEAKQLDGRRLVVRGRLLGDRSVFVDNRTHEGIAGFYVLTPLRIEPATDMHVLVLRGWVPRDPVERMRLPDVPMLAGEVELTGLAQHDLAQVLELKRSPPPAPSQRIWQNLTLDGYAKWSGLRLQPLLLRQTTQAQGAGMPVDDGLVRDWRQPGLDVDKHRGYAFQWYAMALVTAALWGWFVVVRPRWAQGRDGNAEN